MHTKFVVMGCVVLCVVSLWSLFNTSNTVLPVLTDDLQNRLKYDEWHVYFERVYGESVTSPVDLNTFDWFYNFAPLHLLDQRPIGVPFPGVHKPPKRPGTLYYCTSDMICGQYRPHGYFMVSRRTVRRGPVEVLHHSCEWEDDSSEVWFYMLTGSGVFLKPQFEAKLSPLHKPERIPELVVTMLNFTRYTQTFQHRRVLSCVMFSSGWSANETCDCDYQVEFFTRCRHPPVELHRRKLLNKYLC